MKIIAIGGGEIGRPGTKIETLKIDRELLRLSGKKNPKLLFIPTASNDSPGYVAVAEKYFGKKLGCTVETLLLWRGKQSKSQIEKKILSADIVYVGGGNTSKMIRLWKKLGVDAMLKNAAQRGVILSGVSAGAVCWFKEANSDSEKMIDPKADYIKIKCLNFVPLFVCPHFDAEKDRQSSLKRMLKENGGAAVAVDNCAALEIVDDTYRVITSKSKASVYHCYWRGEKYIKQPLKRGVAVPLERLLSS